jgi:hypothetical protein
MIGDRRRKRLLYTEAKIVVGREGSQALASVYTAS